MIDSDNLRTASLYINNQLLSRGLLRDGQGIDFANPLVGGDDATATMGRIMSVVNDLILRRDRDAEHRESLSATMRTLRAENLKHTNDMTRLSEKHVEAKRKLDIAEASEASLKTQMKSADVAVRTLKEEIARTKSLVSQARTACATDVRRRDRQIDTLKKQLGEAGRARGSRGNPSVTTITVTGDVGEQKASLAVNTDSDDYDLRNETNAFLANLAQNLSEENEALLSVMRRTMQQLRAMSGWGTTNGDDGLVVRTQGWEDMTSELDSVLEHMRNILSNPSFVPIEEVMVREEEINRLKDGWVKMESRWTEAVHLMNGWRKRMAASGRPVCDEELQMGMRLSPVRVSNVEETRQAHGFGLSAVAEEAEEESVLRSSPCPSRQGSPRRETAEDYDHHDDSDVESTFDDHVPIEDYDVDEPNVQILQQSTGGPLFPPTAESSPLPTPPQLSPLKDSSSAGNRQFLRMNKSFKKGGEFTTIVEENTWDLAVDSRPPQPPPHQSRASPEHFSPSIRSIPSDDGRERSSSNASLDEVLLVKASPGSPRRSENDSRNSASRRQPKSPERSMTDSGRRSGPQETPGRSPRRTASRLPLPRNADPAPQQSPLTMATIAAKLAASEREADAARPTLAPSKAEPESPKRQPETSETAREDVDPIKHDPSNEDAPLKPEKRRRERRTSKAASRRRSTLNQWELESLIAGSVQ
ncbi:hypothetical protein G7046_g1059 [Stylonectria norvegica]|nr:hypothetical protein G7046_g1059 [Stylonectria norvegica]